MSSVLYTLAMLSNPNIVQANAEYRDEILTGLLQDADLSPGLLIDSIVRNTAALVAGDIQHIVHEAKLRALERTIRRRCVTMSFFPLSLISERKVGSYEW